jgi:hypothetical protein
MGRGANKQIPLDARNSETFRYRAYSLASAFHEVYP